MPSVSVAPAKIIALPSGVAAVWTPLRYLMSATGPLPINAVASRIADKNAGRGSPVYLCRNSTCTKTHGKIWVIMQSRPGCMCGASERVLRHVMRGQASLSPEQREWALKEIDGIEGYTRADYEKSDDAELSQGVFSAWTDYARDKGLL